MKYISVVPVAFLIISLTYTGTVLAEKQTTPDLLKENEIIFADLSQKRMAECQSAFGDISFCECLNINLPLIVDFSTYIQNIIQSKEKLIAKTPLKSKVYDEHKLINVIFSTRDYCVSISQH